MDDHWWGYLGGGRRDDFHLSYHMHHTGKERSPEKRKSRKGTKQDRNARIQELEGSRKAKTPGNRTATPDSPTTAIPKFKKTRTTKRSGRGIDKQKIKRHTIPTEQYREPAKITKN